MRWGFFLLIPLTYVLAVFHLGTAPPRNLSKENTAPNTRSQWLHKDRYGTHHLVLEGTSFERGYFAGSVTKDILFKQEESLQSELKSLIPNRILRNGLFLFSMRWFWGIDKYLEHWMLDEMWGVSQNASHDFDFLADPYTRQIAYHGLHEVGQTMVDMVPESMGCTVLGVPTVKGWIIGRNFDFEGGRIFDEEKIIKWVFPDSGIPFVSVIWAGMVGAVTGVNQEGVYLSINAAGSTDFQRIGMPSTLILLKALQFAKTGVEAIQILKDSQPFITDIFVVGDSKTNQFYRVEKSPDKTVVREETSPIVITNHLISREWEGDKINDYRREKMTSQFRLKRAEELLESLPKEISRENLVSKILQFMRDKNQVGGKHLELGNRRAIDALIATHAVIWDSVSGVFYVSRGPSLAGPFQGLDLKESFKKHTPVFKGVLPPDPEVKLEDYERVIQKRLAQRHGKKS